MRLGVSIDAENILVADVGYFTKKNLKIKKELDRKGLIDHMRPVFGFDLGKDGRAKEKVESDNLSQLREVGVLDVHGPVPRLETGSKRLGGNVPGRHCVA